jgi:hypothetical protein
MSIYLYVKTHSITGLKYLGMTTARDPHAYKGSGVYWKAHLKKHGSTYSTIILVESISIEEIKEYGLHYSALWNVVESNEWANLIPESGSGSMQSPETIAKIMATKKANGTTNCFTAASLAKAKATREINGPYRHAPGTIVRMREAMKGNGHRTSETIAKMKESKLANGTINNSPSIIAKAKATRETNGPFRHTPETIAKMIVTRARNKALKASL